MDFSLNSILIFTAAFSLLASCQMGDTDYMTEHQRQQLETTYDSLQNSYKILTETYDNYAESMPGELHSLYDRIDEMRLRMNEHHNQMMNWHEDRDMQREKMMSEEDMGRHIQTNMAGEWYNQMKALHEQIAGMHETMNQQSLTRVNRQLAEQYDNMGKIIPDVGKPTDIPYNEEGDPALLNGANLYTQNCASCHGSNGEGIGNVFPPLINSDWITGDKSIPIRILINGLSGKIEVNGQSYQGTMPSFRARLSAAEMASILNYLRDQSEGDQSKITQEDIIELSQKYSDRTKPWSAEDFNIES